MRIRIGKRAAGVVGIAASIVLVGATPALAAAGTVHTDSGAPLTVRSAPSTSATSAGTIADGTAVNIDCQTTGETVTGKYGTSNIWDHVPGGYITDTYVYTGSDGRMLCRIRNRSSPPTTACSTSYSTPSFRGHTTRNSPVGSSERSSHASLVMLEPASITRNRRLRVRPTPIQKRSSGSWKTWTSSTSGPSPTR